ncbi:MAG TPA: transglycosylase family protein, partial [Candidatus Saccharimonadia bacterium]
KVKSGPSEDDWYRLRICESGNNYANKHNSLYRGAYQFSYATWKTVGGSGDPADAAPAEQDMRAVMLFNRSGWSQWPVCGRYLR